MNKYLLQFFLGGAIIVSLAHFSNSSSPIIASIIYALPTLFLSSAFFISEKENLINFSYQGSLMLFSVDRVCGFLWIFIKLLFQNNDHFSGVYTLGCSGANRSKTFNII